MPFLLLGRDLQRPHGREGMMCPVCRGWGYLLRRGGGRLLCPGCSGSGRARSQLLRREGGEELWEVEGEVFEIWL